jgi:hypothetical protein
MEKMDAPESRSEFEHNINLLFEEAENFADFSEGQQQSFLIFTYPRLREVGHLPNGRLDINTVDESLRLNANTKNYMQRLGPFKGMPDQEED